MSARVWCLGDAVVDLLPQGDACLMQCPGGAPANVAVGIARLQGNSGFIGRVGDDPFGHFMRQTLAKEQVDTAFMRADAQHRTSTVVVALDEEGERSFTFMVRPSADLFLAETDLPPFARGEWLHCCSIALAAELRAPPPSAPWSGCAARAGLSASTPIFATICGPTAPSFATASSAGWCWRMW